MGKYEPLAAYLNSREDDSWNATFEQIETTLGFPLPISAHKHRAWWANQNGGNHSQAAGWQAAGWETADVDLNRAIVRFERRRKTGLEAGNSACHASLWRTAAEMTGIDDRAKLMEMALTALIHREAGKYLAEIGGTMPDAWAPLRDRPDSDGAPGTAA